MTSAMKRKERKIDLFKKKGLENERKRDPCDVFAANDGCRGPQFHQTSVCSVTQIVEKESKNGGSL